MSDTPANKTGSSNRVLKVNTAETDLEFSSGLEIENSGRVYDLTIATVPEPSCLLFPACLAALLGKRRAKQRSAAKRPHDDASGLNAARGTADMLLASVVGGIAPALLPLTQKWHP